METLPNELHAHYRSFLDPTSHARLSMTSRFHRSLDDDRYWRDVLATQFDVRDYEPPSGSWKQEYGRIYRHLFPLTDLDDYGLDLMTRYDDEEDDRHADTRQVVVTNDRLAGDDKYAWAITTRALRRMLENVHEPPDRFRLVLKRRKVSYDEGYETVELRPSLDELSDMYHVYRAIKTGRLNHGKTLLEKIADLSSEMYDPDDPDSYPTYELLTDPFGPDESKYWFKRYATDVARSYEIYVDYLHSKHVTWDGVFMLIRQLRKNASVIPRLPGYEKTIEGFVRDFEMLERKMRDRMMKGSRLKKKKSECSIQ